MSDRSICHLKLGLGICRRLQQLLFSHSCEGKVGMKWLIDGRMDDSVKRSIVEMMDGGRESLVGEKRQRIGDIVGRKGEAGEGKKMSEGWIK